MIWNLCWKLSKKYVREEIRREFMKDPLNIEQLKAQRTAVKKKIEDMMRKGAAPAEVKKAEDYMKLLDLRIGRAGKQDGPE